MPAGTPLRVPDTVPGNIREDRGREPFVGLRKGVRASPETPGAREGTAAGPASLLSPMVGCCMSLSVHDIPDAVQWHDGMMLAPQHFQEQELRRDMTRAYHTRTLSAFHWGIDTLEIDDVLLVEGTLRILELEAVLPDSTAVSLRASEDRELERDLSEYEDEAKEQPITVHLALPARSERNSQEALQRYDSVEGQPVPDRNQDGLSVRIPRYRPRLTLLVADTPPSRYTSFPLARVEHTENGFTLTEYIPPRLNVPEESSLGALCRSVARQIRDKAHTLAERVQSQAVESGTAMELDGKQMIHMMVSGLPRFEAQMRTGTAHPYALYLSLCTIAGNMAGLTRRLIPPSFPAYDHAEIRACFTEVIAYLDRALEEGVQEAYVSVRMEPIDTGFEVLFEEDWVGRDLVLSVRQRPGQSTEEIEHWMTQSMIGAASYLEPMRERRVLGVPREPITRAGNLVPARNALLFRIDSTSEFIVPGETLVVQRDEAQGDAEPPLEAILYVEEDE